MEGWARSYAPHLLRLKDLMGPFDHDVMQPYSAYRPLGDITGHGLGGLIQSPLKTGYVL